MLYVYKLLPSLSNMVTVADPRVTVEPGGDSTSSNVSESSKMLSSSIVIITGRVLLSAAKVSSVEISTKSSAKN